MAMKAIVSSTVLASKNGRALAPAVGAAVGKHAHHSLDEQGNHQGIQADAAVAAALGLIADELLNKQRQDKRGEGLAANGQPEVVDINEDAVVPAQGLLHETSGRARGIFPQSTPLKNLD
jgi:hypothetical protein